jgi:PTH1 family peptidyl-tRNA hydrolase
MMTVSRLASESEGRFRVEGGAAEVARVSFSGEEVLLARPLTYMNRSGVVAAELVDRHGTRPDEMIVIYDDVDLPLGRLRLRAGGTSGGHKGMQSVIEHLSTTEVPRLRMGILGGKPDRDLSEYVLSEFDPDEWPIVEEMVERGTQALAATVRDGLARAASRFNRGEEPSETGDVSG